MKGFSKDWNFLTQMVRSLRLAVVLVRRRDRVCGRCECDFICVFDTVEEGAGSKWRSSWWEQETCNSYHRGKSKFCSGGLFVKELLKKNTQWDRFLTLKIQEKAQIINTRQLTDPHLNINTPSSRWWVVQCLVHEKRQLNETVSYCLTVELSN